MNIIEYILSWFSKKPPIFTETIKYSDLRTAIYRDLNPDKIYMSDSIYDICNVNELKILLNADKTNYQHYIEEDFDCDDFSYMLMGHITESAPTIAFGIIWVWYYEESASVAFKLLNKASRIVLGETLVHGPAITGHALNCYYDSEKQKMMLIEPQSDNIFEMPENWNTTVVMI